MVRFIHLYLAAQLFFVSANGQRNNIKIATVEDLKTIPNANIGDLIVFGPTRIENEKKIISIGEKFEDKLLPGKKILIAGGNYDEIWI